MRSSTPNGPRGYAPRSLAGAVALEKGEKDSAKHGRYAAPGNGDPTAVGRAAGNAARGNPVENVENMSPIYQNDENTQWNIRSRGAFWTFGMLRNCKL